MVIDVQENGEILIPETLLNELGIKQGDIVDINEIDGRIVIKPMEPSEPQNSTDDMLRRTPFVT